MAFLDRIKNAWNIFVSAEARRTNYDYIGGASSYGSSPSNTPRRFTRERSIVTSVYTRIAIDVAGVDIRHVKLDKNKRYEDDIDSGLNLCLSLEANLDQGPRAFRQDIVSTLFDKGVAAIVPVDTSGDPMEQDNYDIHTLRVGEIVTWHPQHVRVSLYNEKTALREEVTLEKKIVAIVQNPLYDVMNEPNSTLQRLIRKLNLLDAVDEQSGSGKLDLIIQLPYAIKSEARRQQAEQRRSDIEFQLRDSKYGIAYTDGTEKITQLNRAAENNLFKQVEYLTNMLYSQLGITPTVMDGTADEAAMINYFSRTVEPILDAVIESMQRSFLGIHGYKKNERIMYFRDPFKLVPLSQVSEIADRFTRNEILSANEVRQFIGIPPSSDEKADELRNSNMPQPIEPAPAAPTGPTFEEMDQVVNELLEGITSDIEKMTGDVK